LQILIISISISMQLLSVNIGKTKTYNYNNKVIKTAFCKEPTSEIVIVHTLGIKGDVQTNKKYHGGITKAIYAYDESNYNHWKTILPNYNFINGNFGENLTTKGLQDDAAFIGNIYKIGTVLVQVVEPRFPCNTLNFRFNNPLMIKLFAAQACYGIYFKVLQEGNFKVNDTIQLFKKSNCEVTIKDIANQFIAKEKNKAILTKIIEEPLIPQEVKDKFKKYL
jgi:MOSC domain-containing protein YiiM